MITFLHRFQDHWGLFLARMTISKAKKKRNFLCFYRVREEVFSFECNIKWIEYSNFVFLHQFFQCISITTWWIFDEFKCKKFLSKKLFWSKPNLIPKQKRNKKIKFFFHVYITFFVILLNEFFYFSKFSKNRLFWHFFRILFSALFDIISRIGGWVTTLSKLRTWVQKKSQLDTSFALRVRWS